MRIQIFDADGVFLKQWTGIGYPYGLFITPDQHVWMIDGGYDRIVELDRDGPDSRCVRRARARARSVCMGAFPGDWERPNDLRGPRAELASYVPSRRIFWDRVESTDWSTRSNVPKN
jgi:hypothetical protein